MIPVSTTQSATDTTSPVSEDFAYVQKLVRRSEDLALSNAWLKWYEISRPGVDLGELGAECRQFLRSEVRRGSLQLEQRFGFVLLHHCTDVVFLIVLTWNNDNELWQTTYVRELDRDDPFERTTRDVSGHRPMLCVWELMPVSHERDAWVRFLRSGRSARDLAAYKASTFEGMC
jgi:hypothetical protein